MTCAIAVGVGEFLEYLKEAAVAKAVYDDIKSVCTDVTHAYNNGKKVIDTVTGYIDTADTTIRKGKKQLDTLKRRANKIQTAVKRRQVYKPQRTRHTRRRFR